AMLCLRAVRSVTVRNGVVAPATRALMTTAMQSVLMIDADLDALLLITPAELAAGMHTPGLSEQVVQAMLVGVLADGELHPDCVAGGAACVEALGIDLPALHPVRVLCEPHMVLFRLDFLRRSHLKNMLVDQYRHHGGIRGAAAALRGFAGNVSGTGARERYVAL